MPSVSFNAYRSSQSPSSSLLLHSSPHPKLDYTAQEEPSHLRHYLAVFDPASSTLQLVPSKKLIVRSTTRPIPQSTSNNDTPKSSQPKYLARNELGLAFGTKKSQKAIRSLTHNAISPSKKFTKSNAALADAVVSNMAADGLTREAMQKEADEAKPRPKANLDATTPKEVYTIEDLVGGKETLRMVGGKDWVDTIASGGEIRVKSRFVASRVSAVIKAGDFKKLKGLRYLLLLIEWYQALKPATKGGGKNSMKIPKEPELSEALPNWNQSLLSSVSRRFLSPHMPPGILNTHSITLLITTIFALTLCIDNQTTDTSNIKDDLKLEQKQVNALFSELGATVAAPTEAERLRLGIQKSEAKSHMTARLRLPLVWPKLRVGSMKGRR